ncbi:predicted protein [Phaeodactylum tricornutum CCAP 1055/1]|jgi:predicted membrane chloride channel (bestrophin family)|uniref:Uncharacterized protein n=1 Tax=Phaeodactylum tricornutum (strain CCAP 1055/1) TaxID=556484 RepID=B7G8X5_PHATC|nr:predicted protein [Phaeodactylum tricornutum CCAP 1055/1]EEC44724.1 predicted protein [Phaeodactylum tricornutum CCAP 1055/1]|eukprot:XP_002183542.1 predicted protein [Phaeodactylum tricornutum CCAP 1055/1]
MTSLQHSHVDPHHFDFQQLLGSHDPGRRNEAMVNVDRDEDSIANPDRHVNNGDAAPVRQLEWDDRSHWKVLTQIHGSVWPRVLPFCALNVCLTYAIYLLKQRNVIDLTSSPSGHKYMAIMMSFLVVTRVKITYDNYMANSRHLGALYKQCRELVQYVCVLTMTDTSTRAKEWRNSVAYRTIILLRVTMAVLEYPTNPSVEPWNVPELAYEDRDDLQHLVMWPPLHANESPQTRSPRRFRQLPMRERTVLEEACRVPILLAYSLRVELMKQRDGTWLRKDVLRHPCNEEMRMLDIVGDYIKAYSGLQKLMATPLPFPLVQMTKTFLFVWIFSLPFCLCHDSYSQPFTLLTIIFLITFGFVGLEMVAMELSDCFGDDPSDFDDLGHAQMCFEDIYISIYKLDGEPWARKLRTRLSKPTQESQSVPPGGP